MTFNSVKDTYTLHNGVAMPCLGLGVYLAKQGPQVVNAVKWAIEAGYRHIDTAAIYQNEVGVGQGIAQTGIARDQIFVVSKVWNDQQGYQQTLDAFDQSLQKLNLQYLDLYLIHWPVKNKYHHTWRALETLYQQGKVKAIGVSNFMQHHLEDLMQKAIVVPMVNQMEFHPFLVQQDLLNFCKNHHIQYEAWSPLMKGQILTKKPLIDLANKYQKTVAQLVLRWCLQKGVVAIPKSTNKNRITENANIFDFEITQADVAFIDGLDGNYRVGPDPNNFNF